MSDQPQRPSRLGRIGAAVVSAVVAGLLGLAAGSRIDELVRPTVGPTGAAVAGLGTALAILVWLGLVSYRSLTR